MADEIAVKKRKYEWKFCSCCSENVPKSTYYDHRLKRENRHLEVETNSLPYNCNEEGQDPGGPEASEDDENDDYADVDSVQSTASESENGNTEDSDSDGSIGSAQSSDNDSSSVEFLDQSDDNMDGTWISEDDDGRKENDQEEATELERENETCRYLARFIVYVVLRWQSLQKVSIAGIILLINILKCLLSYIAMVLNLRTFKTVAKSIPATWHGLTSCLSLKDEDFEKLVVCPKCNSVYTCEEATNRTALGRNKSGRCSFVEFPNHRQRGRRKKCGALLMKRTKTNSAGKTFLVPKKVYCYKPVTSSLESLIAKHGFLEDCEKWRQRQADEHQISDIYDGEIWREFQELNGRPFLSEPNNFGLMLNVDWFQPYSHSQYSIGVIYLSILNLPRELRFKTENIIIVGIIPGPHEPKRNIDSFLKPFVDELLLLKDGVRVKCGNSLFGKCLIKVALLCVSCDMPAIRKCCGFLGHSANLGCHKCLKKFPRNGFGDKPNYGGYREEEWPKRDDELHKTNAAMSRDAQNKQARQTIEKNHGVRYSELHRLPYFRPVTFSVVDPMHNLLLGTAKHTMKTWKSLDIIDDHDLKSIQKRVDSIHVPHDIGRIPRKISSGFAGFTADQWKNWVCVYSLFSLKGLLPDEDYRIWALFVNACRRLCKRVITIRELEDAHRFLRGFCVAFEGKYGVKYLTPNMHMHLHIKECIVDYGSVFSFWCFSFERFNGYLGDYHLNNHAIGVTMMRKFLLTQNLRRMTVFDEELLQSGIDDIFFTEDRTAGTIKDTSAIDSPPQPIPPLKRIILGHDKVRQFEAMVNLRLGRQDIHVSFTASTFLRLAKDGVMLSTDSYKKNDSLANVIAYYPSDGESTDRSLRGGCLNDFYRVQASITDQNGKKSEQYFIIASISWYQAHPRKEFFGRPVSVWCTTTENTDSDDYIFIEDVACRCAHTKYKVNFGDLKEKVKVLIPLSDKQTI